MTTKVTMLLAFVIAAVAIAVKAQQFPMMDMFANHVIQKYQTATCEQLWMERSEKQGRP